jgi:hypothetical protein
MGSIGLVQHDRGHRISTVTRESLRMVAPARRRVNMSGGDEGTRTPDPLLAKEVLSQLSYIPDEAMLSDRRRWWAFLDSNQRPLPYQGSALTS